MTDIDQAIEKVLAVIAITDLNGFMAISDRLTAVVETLRAHECSESRP